MEGTRALRTVVLTDAAGFTKRMREDEPGALVVLRADISVLETCIAAHDGTIVKRTGDGLLILFESAASAVKASLAAQIKLKGSEFQHRIAIHAGEVFIAENDIYGDVVNVCARIEAETTPGTVRASRMVIDLIAAQAVEPPISLGTKNFKGVAEPIEVFSWGENKPGWKLDWRLATVLIVPIFWGAWYGFTRESSEPLSTFTIAKKTYKSAATDANMEQVIDEVYEEVLTEIDEYDEIRAEAVRKFNPKLVLDWLQKSPMGKRERGAREKEHWQLVEFAVASARGSVATKESVTQSLAKSKDAIAKVALSAFNEEFK
jgi:class 3 adenylate cyclase